MTLKTQFGVKETPGRKLKAATARLRLVFSRQHIDQVYPAETDSTNGPSMQFHLDLVRIAKAYITLTEDK